LIGWSLVTLDEGRKVSIRQVRYWRLAGRGREQRGLRDLILPFNWKVTSLPYNYWYVNRWLTREKRVGVV
jgi:hypothetical protein